MLEFLSPNILWALSLMSIPIILHFLKNINPQKIPFSSIAFLKNLQKQNLKKMAFIQYLLLLLRLLFMALMILAFAQPKWQSETKISFAGKNIIIAVDRSFSVYRNSPDGSAMKNFKKVINDLMKSGDSNTLYEVMMESGENLTFDQRSFQKIARKLEETNYYATDLTQILDKVNDQIKPSRETIIIIFSDRQYYAKTDTALFNSTWDKIKKNAEIFFSVFNNEDTDNGIINISNLKFGIKPSVNVDMTIETKIPEQAEITFFNRNSRIAQKNLDGKIKQNIRIEIGNRKTIDGIAELENDRFSSDNQYYWGIDLSEPGRILFSGDTSNLNILRSIAGIDDFKNSIVTKVISDQGLYSQIGKPWDWLFYAPSTWGKEQLQLIRQYINNGTKIFLCPGKNSDAFVRAIKDLTKKNAEFRIMEGEERIGINSRKFSDKLASYQIRAYVTEYYSIQGRGLLLYDNGQPLIGMSSGIYFLTAPLEKDNGNIHLHPGLPVWFFNWLPQQSRINAFFPQLIAGKDTVLNLTSSWKPIQQIKLTGNNENYILENRGGRINIPGKYILKPGHYYLQAENMKYALAVNTDPREFEDYYFLPPDDSVIGDNYEAMQTVPLWKYLLILAILVLLTETIIRYKNRGMVN